MRMNPKIRLALLAAVVIITTCGCAARHPYFGLLREAHVIQPGSLAVISGDKEPASIGLAAFLTTELRNRSTFRVLSQQEIAGRVPEYPNEISDAKNDKRTMKSLQEKLKTDYLFVVWSQYMTKAVTSTRQLSFFFLGSGRLETDIMGQLFHYPDGTEVGTSSFRTSQSLGITAMRAMNSDNDAAAEMLQSAAASIADDFLDITKAARTRR